MFLHKLILCQAFSLFLILETVVDDLTNKVHLGAALELSIISHDRHQQMSFAPCH